ncbi:hypothetical protein E8E11_009986 [Didymella keratinophila]|nr:hypothetical protein E8E11_009986 [Didymella keratinophila]
MKLKENEYKIELKQNEGKHAAAHVEQIKKLQDDAIRTKREGKIWVKRYGSTQYWDLGLCRAHFEYGRRCNFIHCHLRHEPLTCKEQIYIGALEPNDPEFLKAVRQKNFNRLHKVFEPAS